MTVSLDRLAARHPLAGDLRRLDAARAALSRWPGAAAGGGLGGAGVANAVVLPPLPIGSEPVAKPPSNAESAQRARGELGRFFERASARDAVDLERWRAEQEALLAAVRAERQRAAALVAKPDLNVDAVAVANRRILIAALRSYPEDISAEDARAVRARIQALRAELDALERQEAEAVQRAAAAALATAQIADGIDQTDLAARLRERRSQALAERQSLRRLLTLEGEAAQRFAVTPTVMRSAPAYRLPAAASNPVAPGGGPSGRSAAEALARLDRQRTALRGVIRADVTAAARDVAASHGLNPVFSGTASAMRPDRTDDFARWIFGQKASGAESD